MYSTKRLLAASFKKLYIHYVMSDGVAATGIATGIAGCITVRRYYTTVASALVCKNKIKTRYHCINTVID